MHIINHITGISQTKDPHRLGPKYKLMMNPIRNIGAGAKLKNKLIFLITYLSKVIDRL
jgi:hypothetical protein